MSPSDDITFTTDAYTPLDFITAIPLDTTGDTCGTCKLSGTSGECLLAWCILLITAEKWNAMHYFL
jgi:hypothetical protein